MQNGWPKNVQISKVTVYPLITYLDPLIGVYTGLHWPEQTTEKIPCIPAVDNWRKKQIDHVANLK